MDKELFKDLVQSLNEARSIVRGKKKPSRVFEVKTPDVKMIRVRTGLSQTEFAQLLGVKLKTIQNWEQHRRQPTGPAVVLLTIVEREPETALRALHAA